MSTALHVRNVVFHEEPEPQAEPAFFPSKKVLKLAFRFTYTRKERKLFYRLFFRRTPMHLRKIKK